MASNNRWEAGEMAALAAGDLGDGRAEPGRRVGEARPTKRHHRDARPPKRHQRRLRGDPRLLEPGQSSFTCSSSREHFERMARNGRMLRIQLPAIPVRSPRSRSSSSAKMVPERRVRPPARVQGRPLDQGRAPGAAERVRHVAFPIGGYLPTSGLAARTASWRRTSDDAIPARGKLTGAYINTALAVDEAHDSEADESIFLTPTATSRRAGARTCSWSAKGRS